jgi:hypothetical protein
MPSDQSELEAAVGGERRSGGRRPAVAPELATQLEVLALRGGERSLQVLGLGAVALLEVTDLRSERAHHVALRRWLVRLALLADGWCVLLVGAELLHPGAERGAV